MMDGGEAYMTEPIVEKPDIPAEYGDPNSASSGRTSSGGS